MLRELAHQLQKQSKQHQSNLDSLLSKHSLTQTQVAGMVMKGEELPLEISREVFYLDSVNRIINLVNFRDKNIGDWTTKNYLESLFEETMDWVHHNQVLPSVIVETEQYQNIKHLSDDALIPYLVLVAIKRHEKFQKTPPDGPKAA